MKFKKTQIKVFAAAASFVLSALGAKVSLAYWASAVAGNASNSNGTVTSGSWDRYTTGTAISTCASLKTMLESNTAATFHLTTSLNCSTSTLTVANTTFSGTFYGNGFTISNYTISPSRRGLFYNLRGATVQNLILDNINVGTSSSRSNSFTGILASQITGANTVIKNIRIYNSSAYCSSSQGIGGIVGYTAFSTTISNVMLQNVILNNSNSYAGGIIGRHHGNPITISDVYVEGTIISTSASGGVVGQIDNTTAGVLTLSRAVVFGNTTITANNSYAGGAVGSNARTATHNITDVFYSGALNSGSNRAGTIYNGTAMTYSNAWAAQWSSSTIAAYTNMTGTSASFTTNYVDLRSSLSSSWWNTSLPNITSSAIWVYDSGSYLYELKPRV